MMRFWIATGFFIAFAVPFGAFAGEPAKQVSPQEACNRSTTTGLCTTEAPGIGRLLLDFGTSRYFMQAEPATRPVTQLSGR